MHQGKKYCNVPFVFFVLLLSLLCSCTQNIFPSAPASSEVSITTYNLQTFFDAKTLGTEYDEFKGSKSSWSEEKYTARLNRLCSIIESIDSDIFVFQEIENSSVIVDIYNYLKPLSGFTRSFSYAVFVPSRDGVLGCAVLSRYPILSCTAHQIDIRLNSSSMCDTRPLFEVSIHCGFTSPLVVYAGHWKSKSGDGAESAVIRKAQEEILCTRIAQLGHGLFIFCGDCNKDIKEFNCSGENVILSSPLFLSSIPGTGVNVFSPWLSLMNENPDGSYYYKGAWEKIDHFFAGSAVSVRSFTRITDGSHVDEKKIPVRYTVWNGQGYSDHLPLTCIISEKK